MIDNFLKEAVQKRKLVATLTSCFILSCTLPNVLLAQQVSRANIGYLNIVTKRNGLEVRIDSEFAGFTPLRVQELTTGLHEVRVGHPNRLIWLDGDWIEQVNVTADDTVTVFVRFQRSFSVNSEPYGARATLNGDYVGETPVFFKLEEGGLGKVTLSKQDFRDTTFVVGDSEVQFFDVTLQASNLEIQLQLKAAAQKQHSKKRLRFLTSLGASVVSGAVALYFREKADSRYDKYLKTGDPQKFEKLYDDAKKFDKFAAVSFGVFQVSVVFSFYSFLKFVD